MPKKKAVTQRKKAARKSAARKTGAKRKSRSKPAKRSAGGRSKRGKRYSDKLKASLLGKYHALRRKGLSTSEAAKKVQVSYITLRKWEKELGVQPPKVARRRKAAKTSARKTPKQARARRQKTGLILVTPTGYSIEGISAGDLIRVLKATK